ncbi:MAG: bifunctional hydroxymethylpyrimidine kinase/phosphomethylpyrimidine kinase [Lentisphaerae bacterium]|jgi:hydroxymethylpyrimidine/phosphomethylpyrimidine kinase|nr:bifunctional hydroxymethylpyrimidine kinase/phosphomethylpyrimidine kinase [Lentisphaerota bacterium]MBT4820672.1 bifunctional hydroxymethylpyrimidine kinase/phosphomethylpyrimidine kinase [Lentisphaerota bacterium]MBT5608548.1 bifunctional hydroxymethylpyrimidine kinase/phosphomethylpyrimidine kinase [Lentisphaerota bacterium]MBT7061460.1 bifunctional hydroxymethylpyrimidine kinase/phosphomethylpyrimidine kinase [Lentisphaerota bacterium]MBT7844531.1 bifunctional hydroxymethylpyrimidine kin
MSSLNSAIPPSTRPVPGIPVALTVAGSDSGGGAGIQADLAAFSYFDVFGTTAITAVTAQNPKAVTAVHPVPPTTVSAQVSAVMSEFSVAAIKTGMLFSAEIIAAVADVLGSRPGTPLVVDPVMVATSGAKLLQDVAIDALKARILPQAQLVTPNLPEAEILWGQAIPSLTSAIKAARALAGQVAGMALVKGGHGGSDVATDVLSDGDSVWLLEAPRCAARSTHGTGCSLSAAAAACLALGQDPLESVVSAKAYVLGRLQSPARVGSDLFAMLPPSSLPRSQITVRKAV